MNVEQLPEHWAAGCSNASRWVNCPDSKNAVDDREPGKAAMIGTLGHKIVEQLLRGETVRLDPDDQELIDGMNADDEFDGFDKVTFADAIMLCFTYVKKVIDSMDESDTILFETKIVSNKIGNHGGTVDVIFYSTKTGNLHVIDFKFGRVAVECEENYQLGAYINLARQLFPNAKRFFGTIIQPAHRGAITSPYPVEWLDEWLLDAAVAADPDNHTRVAGAGWCEWCPMLPTCKEAAKMGRQAGHDFQPIAKKNFEGQELTDEDILALEKIVIVGKVAKKQLVGSIELLKDTAKKKGAGKLEFHRITQTKRRAWKDDAEDFADNFIDGEEIYKNDLYVTNLRTPAQVRDILKIDQEKFDKTFDVMLECSTSGTLRAGKKPSADDLKEFEPVT